MDITPKDNQEGYTAESVGISVTENQYYLLFLLNKTSAGVTQNAAEIGCGEHVEPITRQCLVSIVGLSIFNRVIHQILDEGDAETKEEIEQSINDHFEKEIKTLYLFTSKKGFSQQGIEAFVNAVTIYFLGCLKFSRDEDYPKACEKYAHLKSIMQASPPSLSN